MTAMPQALPETVTSRWEAELELGFASSGPRTVPARRRHRGPLVVQKPFYPEGEPCHMYLLHPPSGLVGGDHLTIDVQADAGAHAVLTTPASAKFYRSAGPVASQVQRLRVDEGGVLEWLPQDTILFDGCNAELDTRVELAPKATYIGWDVLCLGRPASGDHYAGGRCRQRLELWRDGEPLLLERTELNGGEPAIDEAWGLNGHTVVGTLLATSANRDTLEAVRADVHVGEGTLFSATLIDDVLVCRYQGRQAQAALQCFETAWRAIRPRLLDRPACPPRIWRT